MLLVRYPATEIAHLSRVIKSITARCNSSAVRLEARIYLASKLASIFYLSFSLVGIVIVTGNVRRLFLGCIEADF